MTTRTKHDEVKPWERQENESRQAFEAFATYRDMGAQRSIVKVARELGKSEALISRWSSTHEWVKRAEAYDAEMDRVFLKDQEKARRDMAERQARIAMMFQNKVVDRLRSLDPMELSPAELARWFDVAVKVERLARGESTDKTEVDLSGQVNTKHEEHHTHVHTLDRYAESFANLIARRKAMGGNGGDPSEDSVGEPLHSARADTETS
ncbi:MAG: hypothetical protein K6T83_03695 [Alicyclobacillus sp.]|nr:hypothetical protein [Alicyclobacillus sp.]